MIETPPARRHKARVQLAAISTLSILLILAAELAHRPILIWNATASVPVGLYRLSKVAPVLGDIVTAATGLYIIHQSSKLGASKLAITRMFINWGIDTAVGLVPVVGDVFDIMFKSNTKNVKLLIADLEARAVELREVNREQRLAAAA